MEDLNATFPLFKLVIRFKKIRLIFRCFFPLFKNISDYLSRIRARDP